ncbi:hypothetical protein EELLY_v1c03980 [Entomoplasma ellychniae]|uniref:Uncharacterized protein n=1 Tax=Entomoplasma ellychniae TaxID=2114 RepID=A0A8E2QYV3_9MOLU|nr:hypothetical protein [Entomoplasma ellychniae]PPE04718.1 hypothetical protein EELLY_v1c03980 [Entomoplasma ellychniae]
MRYKKFLSLILSFLLVSTSVASLYLGFKNLNLNLESKNEKDFLINKVMFSQNEWTSFINKKAEIDIQNFELLFLRKLQSQASINKITFEWNKTQVVVKLVHKNKQYSWFYNLQKKFVI